MSSADSDSLFASQRVARIMLPPVKLHSRADIRVFEGRAVRSVQLENEGCHDAVLHT